MATKSEIKAKIESSLSANPSKTTRLDHESFLHTNANSLLEAIYPEDVFDTEATNNVVTKQTTDSDYDYSLSIVKTGRKVTISGVVRKNTASSTNDVFANITNPEYHPSEAVEFVSIGEATSVFNSSNRMNRSVTVSFAFGENTISVNDLPLDYRFRFIITYNAKN